MIRPEMSQDHQDDSTELDLVARAMRLRRFFDVDGIARSDVRPEDIIRYYKRSRIGYSLVHSREGSIHMSLSRNGVYDPSGYDTQVDIVSAEVARIGATRILELGCGRGYNIVRLAKGWPKAEFVGIELSPDHVALAIKEARLLSNVFIRIGDFESLVIGDQKFDLAYSIESICHARDPGRVLSEAARAVSPGGHLLVVDGWRTDKASTAAGSLLSAISLTEKSMAVGNAMELGEWRYLCTTKGWKVLNFTDLTREVMPNLERFERLADRLISKAVLARFATWILPCDLMNNVVAGSLIAQSVRQGFHVYGFALLERKANTASAAS